MINFKDKKVDVKTEFIAALTTFMTAAYIIFVNPDILSVTGMDKTALIVVTCLAASIGTILVGLWANVPYMMAPGMGLNAFFAYTLVIGKGIPWQTALGVVFLSGVVFLILTFIGIREKVIKAIPESLRFATSVGIGLFIAFIGLKNLGLVVKNEATLVSLGSLNFKVIIGLVGLIVITYLEIVKVRGAIFIGIVVSTILAVVIGDIAVPSKIISAPPSISPIFFQLDIIDALQVSLLSSLFAFMYVDLFDSLGTILAVSSQAGLVREDKTIPGLSKILSADAIATVIGSLLGTSTTTTYIESSSGVAAGGKSGLTSIFIGGLFILAIFFAPILSIVPSYATAPALIFVGIYMMRDLSKIDFQKFDEALPAFLTFVLIPLTYSINTGIMFGFISYVIIKIMLRKFSDINIVMLIVAALSFLNLILT
jgi:AGZA family xanthine/uracil permease-like MFS transporter